MTEMQTPPGAANADGGSNDGRIYWRSLEQLADSDRYNELVHNEFMPGASEPPAPTTCRAAGSSACSRRRSRWPVPPACRKPYRKIMPFAKRPEDMVPGVPNYYATSLLTDGYANGVVVRSFDGRPIKVEGNALHPSNLGAANSFHLGEILNVYDPARSRGPAFRPEGSAREGALADEVADGDAVRSLTMADFDAWWTGHKGTLGDGSKVAVLMPPTTSPTLLACLEEAKAAHPKLAVYTWSPTSRHNEVAGTQAAFGKALDPQFDFTAADVVVSLDADFLSEGPMALRYSRDFASTRRPYDADEPKMSRLYVAESTMTVTGGQADHRFRLKPSEGRDRGVRAGRRARAGRCPIQVDFVHREERQGLGSPRWRRICRPRGVAASCSRGRGSRPPCTPPRTRSTSRWAMSARPSATPIRRAAWPPTRSPRCVR